MDVQYQQNNNVRYNRFEYEEHWISFWFSCYWIETGRDGDADKYKFCSGRVGKSQNINGPLKGIDIL